MTEVLLVLILLLSGAALFFAYSSWPRRGADHTADFAALKARAEAEAESLRALEKSLRDDLGGSRRKLADTLRAQQESARTEQSRIAAELQAKSEAVRAAVIDSLRAQGET